MILEGIYDADSTLIERGNDISTSILNSWVVFIPTAADTYYVAAAARL